MNLARPAAYTVVFLFGMLVCEFAWADQAAEDYAKLPVCKLGADGVSLAVQPCRTAPAQVPMPRRPVPQTIDRMPQVKTAPQVGMPPTKPSTSLQSLTHPPGAPVPLTGCDAAGCYGANGVRYNNSGTGVISPSGKTCSKAGATVQC